MSLSGLSGLDLKALEIFRTVATEGSVSKAAVKLGRVQSNVSTRVRRLETQLEKTLFLRQNRRLTLTPDGQILLAYADRLLELSNEAVDALNEGAPSGILHMGSMEGTAAARLPEILGRYQERHPKVQINLETDTAGSLLDRLLRHDIEVAFIAEPVACDGVETVPVFEESLVLVAPKSFPEIDRPEQVSGHTVIAFEPGCAYRRYLEDWLLQSGITPSHILSVSSYLAIFACVAAGTGYAVAPKSVFDLVSPKGEFQVFPLPGKLERIKTLLAWRAGYTSSKLVALRELLPAPR